MTRLLSMLLLLAASAASQAATAPANAADLMIERVPFGSGMQNAAGPENAQPVADFGVWHAPQYMPGYPTAATIWPRVVLVQCKGGTCDGYAITPNMGSGEYLFFKPVDK
ncbi:MAG: hypothetical protein J7556_00590 [Acidovorax sp.]|nr:hypothetical protein [Acidovorax sp.]